MNVPHTPAGMGVQDMLTDFDPTALPLDILLPALAAGLLVLLTHVPLGMEVLRRGIIFMDLAIAQFAGLGIIAAHALGLGQTHALGGGQAAAGATAAAGALLDHWEVQAAAVGAALLGALLLRWTERRAAQRQEALIGVAFVVASSAAILLLAKDPQGGEHLQELLVGQILWSSWTSLLPLAITSAVILLLWGIGLRRVPLFFYLSFAVLVTASVQVVGVYLVFASLIVPALVAGRHLWRGYGVGATGYVLGLFASLFFDLPAGAAIVLALALCATLLGWRRGLGLTP